MAIKKNKKRPGKSKSQVLQDHKRVGKRFIPPLLVYPGDKLSFVSWYRDLLPEFLWIALLCDQQGYRVAVDSVIKLSDIVNTVVRNKRRRCGFCLASDYDSIEYDGREEVISKIDQELRNILNPCIGIVVKFYPDFPMSWLVSSKWINEISIGLEALEDIKRAIRLRTDKTSKASMECQVLAYVMEVKSGKLKLHEFHDPNLISEYPNSDESRKMAAFVRAMMNGLILMRELKTDWASKFWRHSYAISPCEYPSIDSGTRLSGSTHINRILEVGDQFTIDGKEELKTLWNKVTVDLANPKRTDVIAGLLARNLQFACDIVQSPNLWIMPIAAILIRCMVETQIRLQWLIKCGTDKDFDEYVKFGLGQEKLLVEHYKRISEDDRPDRQLILDDIQTREAWINSQLFTFLLPVDIGAGTQGKDLRTLAQEAGALDLHRLVYSPLSSAVHGHWNTIARLNLSPCLNPLHCGHHLPILPSRPINLSCAIDAIDFYANCYELVSSELTGESMESKAASTYMGSIEKAVQAFTDETDHI